MFENVGWHVSIDEREEHLNKKANVYAKQVNDYFNKSLKMFNNDFKRALDKTSEEYDGENVDEDLDRFDLSKATLPPYFRTLFRWLWPYSFTRVVVICRSTYNLILVLSKF